jgi:hypothetical protein
MKASEVIEALQSYLDYEVVVCAQFAAIPATETAFTLGINANEAERTVTITVDVSAECKPQQQDEAVAKRGRHYRRISIRSQPNNE